jgi:hypothetical protein
LGHGDDLGMKIISPEDRDSFVAIQPLVFLRSEKFQVVI